MKAMIQGGNLSKSVKDDIKKQFLILLDKYNYDAALQVLHILHFDFDFDEEALQLFADRFTQMQKEQKERYELADDDTPWICEEQLRKDGIYIDNILKGGSGNG